MLKPIFGCIIQSQFENKLLGVKSGRYLILNGLRESELSIGLNWTVDGVKMDSLRDDPNDKG